MTMKLVCINVIFAGCFAGCFQKRMCVCDVCVMQHMGNCRCMQWWIPCLVFYIRGRDTEEVGGGAGHAPCSLNATMVTKSV